MTRALRRVGIALLTTMTSACSGGAAAGVDRCEEAEPGAAPRVLVSEPAEYRLAPPSAESGERYFAEIGMGDPYSAGMAYPVLLALLALYPERLGRDLGDLADRFGFLRDPDAASDPWAVPVGLHLTTDPNTGVPFVVSTCTLCHAGAIELPSGPRVVSGLGNARLRIHAYDSALLSIYDDAGYTEARLLRAATRAARDRGVEWPEAYAADIVRETVRGTKARADARREGVRRIGEGLPGRVATIESFIGALRMHRAAQIPFSDAPIGWARIPDVAPYRHRETISFDGATVGDPAALIAEADFAFGVRTEWIETHRHIPVSIHLFLRAFERELDFPGEIDGSLADRGQRAFEARCAGCHGRYGRDGTLESYRERVIPLDVVGTDPARANAVTEAFAEAVDALPDTAGLTHTRRTGGYVPPPLVDAWARAPYGHAGQWPDLAFLATPPDERPRRIIVSPASPYDLERVGLAWRPVVGDDAPTAGEHLVDGAIPGHDPGGHPFLADAPPDERRAILEHLKRL